MPSYIVIHRNESGTYGHLVHSNTNLSQLIREADFQAEDEWRGEKALGLAIGIDFDPDTENLVIQELGEAETYVVTAQMFHDALNQDHD
jgi:hypothetical protein